VRTVLVLTIAAVAGACALAAATAGAAPLHSNRCHVQHTCPSDHASYRWKGWLCVKPSADERTAAFKKKVTYAGRNYLCKR
jgi:hypothetical protein